MNIIYLTTQALECNNYNVYNGGNCYANQR